MSERPVCPASRAALRKALWTDPWVVAAVFLGFIGLFFPSRPLPPLWRIAVLALAEEVIFRAGVQDWLETRLNRRYGPFSLANGLASGVFALAHLGMSGAPHAASVFFPSLVFGLLWTRHRSIALCAAMHTYYNVMYFL